MAQMRICPLYKSETQKFATRISKKFGCFVCHYNTLSYKSDN
jgi:hypothetical protein